MNIVLGSLVRLLTARPWITIGVLIALTIVLGYGTTYREPPTEGASLAFMPPGHPLLEAADIVEEHFPETGAGQAINIIFRGEALTPEGLAQMDALYDDLARDPAIREMLAADNPLFSPSFLFKSALQVDDLSTVSQQQIDSVRNVPAISQVLSTVIGTDADDTRIALGTMRLLSTPEDKAILAQERIHELALASEGPLAVSSLSARILEIDYTEAIELGFFLPMMLAFVLIGILLFVFTRSLSDTLLSVSALGISVIWILGVEGWLGPGALGWIGPPSSLTVLVPIVIISLTVDYAIQTVSHYREHRLEGEPVRLATRLGLRNVAVPLILAATTTMAGMFASRFSPVEVIGDFGVVGGLGVGLSLIVVFLLLPAGRTIIDARREARGSLPPVRAISTTFPGVRHVAEIMGRQVTRRPAPYIVGVLAFTMVLGYFATNLESSFSVRDILNRNGPALADIESLEEAVGGTTAVANLIVRGEVTDARTLLNIHDLTSPFDDEATRPSAAAGAIQWSPEALIHDWTNQSGEPGDKYDPELAALLQRAAVPVELDPTLMQEFIDQLLIREPALAEFLVNNPDGEDIMLLQLPVFSEDLEGLRSLQPDIHELWLGDDEDVILSSGSIITLEVGNQIVGGQTNSIGTTVAVALIVLSIFFWATARQPALAAIAVIPIVFVLIAVLGTMQLLGIDYSIMTSIITALSIGIGVDYTIHIIHRYREEYSAIRNPERAAITTLSTTGSALLGSAMTTAIGFGILTFSPLAAAQAFGITATITILYSLIVSVVLVLPALVLWGAYQNMRLRSMALRWAEELDLEIDAVHQRHEAGA